MVEDFGGETAKGPDASVPPSDASRTRRSRVLLGIAALVAAAFLAIVVHGLIGSDSRNPLRSRLAAAISAMRETSVGVKLTTTDTSNGGRPTTMEGVFDFRRGVGRLTVPASSKSGRSELLMLRGDYYANDPAGIPTNAPLNTRWTLQVSPRGAPSFVGGVLQFLMDLQTGSDTRDLGLTKVDSVSVRHYEGPESTLAVPKRLQPATAVLDLYLDAHNRVVRLVERRTFKHETETGNIEYDFSNYGIPVEVAAPPADQVVKLP